MKNSLVEIIQSNVKAAQTAYLRAVRFGNSEDAEYYRGRKEAFSSSLFLITKSIENEKK